MLAERLRQARACFDTALDIHHESGEASVLVAAGNDLERLEERHARLEHGRELPREKRNVALGDPAATAESLAPHLADADALTPFAIPIPN